MGKSYRDRNYGTPPSNQENYPTPDQYGPGAMTAARRSPINPNSRFTRTYRDPLAASGVKGTQYDTDRKVIGGYRANAQGRYEPFGSKVPQGTRTVSQVGKPITPGLDRLAAMNANSPAAVPSVKPAQAFRTQTSPLDTSAAPAAPAAVPAVDPATLTPQIATNTPGRAPLVNGERINRLTGKPMGWSPGDAPKTPAATAPQTTANGIPFGADVAKKNLAAGGLNAAVADFQKRDAEESKQRFSKTTVGSALAASSTPNSPKPIAARPTWSNATGVLPEGVSGKPGMPTSAVFNKTPAATTATPLPAPAVVTPPPRMAQNMTKTEIAGPTTTTTTPTPVVTPAASPTPVQPPAAANPPPVPVKGLQPTPATPEIPMSAKVVALNKTAAMEFANQPTFRSAQQAPAQMTPADANSATAADLELQKKKARGAVAVVR